MPNEIAVEVDGKRYRGWKTFSARKALDALATTFSFEAIDRWTLNNQQWQIFPGKECKISVDAEELAWGFIDSVSPSLGADSHGIRFSGRDYTGDLVDCSVVNKPGTWNSVDLLRIVQDLAGPFGINVAAEVAVGPKFKKFAVKQGETVFEAMSRAAKERGVLLVSGRIGNIRIVNAGTTTAADSIVSGYNVLSADATYDFTGRYSQYTVRGCSKEVGSGWNATTISVEGTAEDEEVGHFRPMLSRGKGVVSVKDAQTHARWEANVRAAGSFQATVRVQGFRQRTTNDLWEPGPLVRVAIPEMLLDGQMVISAVEYSQNDSGGSVSTLTLTRPDAYAAAPPEKVKKVRDLGWGTPSASSASIEGA